MLPLRQLIPPVSIHAPDGRTIRAWDFKQKRSLAIAFLDAGCEPCADFLRCLSGHATELREKNAVAFVVFLESPPPILHESLSAGIFAGVDFPGRGVRAFLGKDTISSEGLARRGVFVVDRYGELFSEWIVPKHDFPTAGAILSALSQIEIVCEECP